MKIAASRFGAAGSPSVASAKRIPPRLRKSGDTPSINPMITHFDVTSSHEPQPVPSQVPAEAFSFFAQTISFIHILCINVSV